MVLAAAATLAVTAAAFLIYEVVAYRAELKENVGTLARVVARNSTAALAFRSEKDANDVLSALEAEPQIVAAALYTADGRLFARYPKNASPDRFPKGPQHAERRFENGHLIVFDTVSEAGRELGTIYLESSLLTVWSRMRLHLIILGAILLGSLVFAWLFSLRLQRGLSEPILALAGAARKVSEQGDYSVRASKLSDDELGTLTDAFNQMLRQIQTSNQAMQQSGERLRLALEASLTGTWDWELPGNQVIWDDYSYRLFGLQPRQFRGTFEHFLELVHPEDRAILSQAIQRSLKHKKDLFNEYRVIWPDKSIHILVTRGRAQYNEKGTPVRMTGVTLDVTQAREAEGARRLLAAIVESSDDAIIAKDLQGHILSWNHGAEQMFGYPADAVLGRTMDFLIPEDKLQLEREALQRVSRGEAVQTETTRRRKDGGILDISLSVSPVRNAHGQIIAGSFISRDITRRKQDEAELLRLKEELEKRVHERTAELEAANMEMEAFSYSVAHDLRAPLRHIDAYTQVVLSDFPNEVTPEMRKYLERISNSTKNLGRLVDDLLSLARVGRQDLRRQRTNLNAIVQEVMNELAEETRGRDIDWRIQPLPYIECDPGLVKQVYANLLSNAVKYTRPQAKAMIEVGSAQQQGETVLFVKDNGVGFDMRYAHKLFGVFQRLHRPEDFEGTGVGLATVARIVHKHRGKVWTQAELDKGATFFFTLGTKP